MTRYKHQLNNLSIHLIQPFNKQQEIDNLSISMHGVIGAGQLE